jgi:hypothetical protein
MKGMTLLVHVPLLLPVGGAGRDGLVAVHWLCAVRQGKEDVHTLA